MTENNRGEMVENHEEETNIRLNDDSDHPNSDHPNSDHPNSDHPNSDQQEVEQSDEVNSDGDDLDMPPPKINFNNVNVILHKTKIRNVIWQRFYGKSERINFNEKLFLRLFDYYIQHIRRNKEESFEWKITKDYFRPPKEKWETRFKSLKKLKKIFLDTVEDDDSEPIFNEYTKKWLKKEFDRFYIQNIKPKEKTIDELQDEEDDEVTGFTPHKKFIEYNPEYKDYDFGRVDVESDNTFIPNEVLSSQALSDLVVKEDDVPKFLVNPNIRKSKTFNVNRVEITQKVKVRVNKTIRFEENMFIIGSYIYRCPECSRAIHMKPVEMNKKTIKHYNCPANDMKPVSIDKKGWTTGSSLKLYCYEVFVYDGDEMEKNHKHFFSFEKNIAPGIYYADVVMFSGRLISPDDKVHKAFMFGIKNVSTKLLDNMIDENAGLELAKSFGCQPHRIFTIWNSVLKYYWEERGIYLNPHKGGFLQLCLVFSAVAKIMFNDRNFAISVIGDTSVSKTYPARLITQLMDIDSAFVSGNESQTYAGVYGGVDRSYVILGKSRSVFVEGLAGKGMVVFDEASHFFKKESTYNFNDNLKSLHNNEINIAKMGGQTVIQRFTPCIFSNFSSYHKGMESSQQTFKDMSYEGLVKEYYWKVLKDLKFDEYSYHPMKSSDAKIYAGKQNLYLPLQFYENEELRLAISLVRNLKIKKDTCWYSGGSIPAQNRILFDCVVQRTSKEKAKWSDVQPDESNVYNLATMDFISTIRDYCGKVFDMRKTGKHNPDYEHLESLKKQGLAILEQDEELTTYFYDGTRIDEKVSGMVVSFMRMLQLINNPKSKTFDDSTLDLMKKVLFKCKRGLTEKEYNFLDHSFKPDSKIINDVRYSLDMTTDKISELEEHKKRQDIASEVQKAIEEQNKMKDIEYENIDINHIEIGEAVDTNYQDEDEKWLI